jgi:hypothetical protein
MKQAVLERFAHTPMGVFGELTIDGVTCYTVERPWLDNKPNESCIPEGVYSLELGMYNNGGYPAYEIMNVPDRSLIKMHIANNMNDVVGCVGFGSKLGFYEGLWSVLGSRGAMNGFMKAMDGEDGQIIIKSKQVHSWG